MRLTVRRGTNTVSPIPDLAISLDLSNLMSSNGDENGNISAMMHHTTPILMQDKLFNNNA
ncbi:MAG: hypothetical protein WCF97_03920 [Nitrososphaeraceae archaeon]